MLKVRKKERKRNKRKKDRRKECDIEFRNQKMQSEMQNHLRWCS